MLVVGGNMFKRSRFKFASSARSAPLLVDFLEPRALLTAAPAGAILINAGGPAYTDSLGQTWQADTDFSGGSTTNETFAVANTSDPALYSARRWGNFSYNIPVTAGAYNVTLLFCESRVTTTNSRLFDVSAEGQQIVTNLDLFATVGLHAAYNPVFPVEVADGALNLVFTTVKDSAIVSGIEVVPLQIQAPIIPILPITPITPITPPVTPPPSNSFIDTDIGSPSLVGSAITNPDGSVTVSGGGADIFNNSDAFNFDYEPLAGDGTIVAQLISQEATDPWAKAGVMIRETLDSDSSFVDLVLTPANGVAFQARTMTDTIPTSITQPAPLGVWLKLVRAGSLITGYFSVDDTNWTSIAAATLQTTDSIYVGLAVTAHNDTMLSAVTFANISVTSSTTTPPPVTPPPVTTPPPTSSFADADIGAVGLSGGSVTNANGSVTVSGSGADIWNDADAFNFAYQPLVGDGSIIAQITNQTNTNSWAKAGVMIRETLNSDSRFVMLALTPGNGVTFQARSATHNVPTSMTKSASTGVWLKLTRTGSLITGSISTDGVNWTPFGSATIPMVNNIYVGLGVSAHDNTKLSSAAFANISITANGNTSSVWSDGSVAPMARWESQTVTYNNKLYIFGGYIDRALDATTECDVYDPSTNTWSLLTQMPAAITHGGTTLVGDTVYFVGGNIGSFTHAATSPETTGVLTYNLDTNTWGTIAALPSPVAAGGLVAINDVLYYFGGVNQRDGRSLQNIRFRSEQLGRLGRQSRDA